MTLLRLCTLALCLPSSAIAITPQRVIVATDDNPTYIAFWPMVARAWKERIGLQPTLALIADEHVVVDESLGDVIRFEPLPGVPSSFYAQAIRLLLPTLFPNDVCLLSDIDMLPISKIYYLNLVRQIPDDQFVVYNDRAYGNRARQYPICYNVAKGSTYREIFNVRSIDEIPGKICEWHAFKLGWTSDEVLLYWLLRKWSGYPKRLTLLGYQTGNQRIDRSK